jgi:hypothetical protein
MIKTNERSVIEFVLQCQPGYPRTSGQWKVDRNGKPFILPGIGGITLNLQVGTRLSGGGRPCGTGVSCTADTHKPNDHPNNSLQLYACVGNKARVISGEARAPKGGAGNARRFRARNG